MFDMDDDLPYIDSLSPQLRRRHSNNMTDASRNLGDYVIYPAQSNVANVIEDNVKYEMFCKWLKMCDANEPIQAQASNEKLEAMEGASKLEDMMFQAKQISTIDDNDDDDDDEFVDTEPHTDVPIVHIDEEFLPISLAHDDEHIDEHSEKFDVVQPIDISKLLSISPSSSTSDVSVSISLKPAAHKKGRAPPIPTTKSLSDDDSPCENLYDDCKRKKKKNLLTFLPGIFKSLSPSNSSQNISSKSLHTNEDNPHETMIN